MRANYDWQPDEVIYYCRKDRPKKYIKGKIIKRDFVDMYGVKNYLVEAEDQDIPEFVPYDNVCDEDMVEHLNDICNLSVVDTDKGILANEEKEMLHNKESYYAHYAGVVNLTMSYLSMTFGNSFVWKTLGHELVGCSEELDRIVVIDDGICCNDAHNNTGWHTIVYDFKNSCIDAVEWFNADDKYCNEDDVDVLEFTMNGIDFPKDLSKHNN